MNRVIFFVMSLMAMLSVGCKSDTPAPEPIPQPEPQAEFEVEITKTTRSTVTFSVTPRNLDMEYLCVVYDKDTADEFTRDEFLVESILMEIAEEASNSGKTLTEYMPEVVDKGVIEEASFSGLSTNTEHYIILFGVENNDGYSASTEITKVAFTTATVEKVECEFDVETTVVDNSVTLAVTPSNSEISWYLCTMPKDTYNYYVEDENGYNMSHSYFYEYYFQQDINAYLQQGNTAEQVVEALIHSGSVELQAKGLKENTDYYYLIAGLILDEEGIVICTDVARGEYRTEGAAQSEMTFEIEVWDIGQMEASFSITPSNNKDKYCALVAPWDGVTEAQDMMHQIVNQWGSWMEAMANDRGPVEHSGTTAFRLPAADTQYYIIAFGYDGGITTEAEMKTFRTLPGGSVDEVVFEVTASSVTPYGFTMNVKSSDNTIYYVPGICRAADYDEATFVGYENEAFDYYLEEYKKFNPAITVAEILDQYYYNGNSTLQVSGLESETEYMAYIYALDVHTGDVVKCFTFDAFAHTSHFSDVAPQVEFVGYFSGDDEGGAVFGDAAATKGKAITVVKYTGLEDVRTLFSTMVEGDCSSAVAVSDGELWQITAGYWERTSTTEPYTFYLVDWNEVQTALCYGVDNSGMTGRISRLYTCPTAENKSDIAILKKITDALNTRSSASSLLLPESVVIGNTLPSRPVIKPIE